MKIDWPVIETVLLDMDGTLLDLHYDNYFWCDYLPELYAQKNDIALSEAMATLNPLFTRYLGTLEWYSVDFWSTELELDIMRHKQEIAHKIAYRPDAETFLQTCRAASDDVRLITNAHRKVLGLKIERTKLDQYFDQLHCSHELGFPKERTQFWQALQSIKAFDPEKTLFVDDSESVLESAYDYGIKHIYSIAKPDMQREREQPSRFEMIEAFV